MTTLETMITREPESSRNPTRWLRRTIRRTAKGVGEAGQRLRQAATGVREAIDRTLEQAPPLAIEILTIWIRQMILTVIELGIGGLVRKLAPRPKPAKLLPFPTLDPAS